MMGNLGHLSLLLFFIFEQNFINDSKNQAFLYFATFPLIKGTLTILDSVAMKALMPKYILLLSKDPE